MSFEAVLWATSDAPIANVNEFAVLVMLAEKADSDGCSAFPARATVAARTTVDPKTVQRTINALAARKLIGPGNPKAAEYIRADRRPSVWDLLIPYGWFPNIERINKERVEKGKSPLTRENRPPIAPPPAKKTRSDKGRKRGREQADERGDSQSTRSEGPLGAHGGTVSPVRGDSESGTGGLEDPRTSPYEPDVEPVLPSAATDASSGKDGRTDGASVPHQISRNPGVDLLSAIGAQQPEFLLTGQTLQDQGIVVAGMLLQGWTPKQLRQVIAGRPLPQPIRTTVGAVVSRRLRDALSGPAPSASSDFGGWSSQEDKPTPTPATWTAETVAPRKRIGECEGDDGLCGRPTEPGELLCRRHASSHADYREDVTA
ncbi:helix-turn-helix domain-containing protein [Streptomyces sp. NBC_00847]|uniref:helix-turn-helix domain-containing protein n=1 Tax=Streptomyces sp. NBC_00847 TaxID=2975850 RepID=UPI00225E144B|nr:helix-turn-helix domain-containing protein [Streptomyces sp. NBC_00847]MCX4885898.1 helix-turn-helix domain-containing protein [Streptomyces sp. NBC_00847]